MIVSLLSQKGTHIKTKEIDKRLWKVLGSEQSLLAILHITQ